MSAGKGFTGGRPVEHEKWGTGYEKIRGFGENKHLDEDMTIEQAVEILGLEDEDLQPVKINKG